VRQRWRSPGVQGDIEAIGYACRGLKRALVEERPVRIQLAVAAAAVFVGWRRKISREQWGLVTLTVASVVGEEVRNASLERLCDFVEPEHNREIGLIKDSSASAVFVRGLGSLVLAAIIFLPRRK